VRNQFNNL